MKALIIDDDPDILEVVSLCFEIRWPEVTVLVAADGAKGIATFERERPDIVILDLGLPDMDGVDVFRELKALDNDVHVIMLTVRDQAKDVVRGLEVGADDYITKPFNQLEFLARVRAVMRRGKNSFGEQDKVFTNGLLTIDFLTREVTLGDELVRLTPTEYSLLSELANNPGRPVSHRDLLLKVWGPEYETATEYLKVHIQHLRRKLKDSPDDSRIIATERGVGYRLVANPRQGSQNGPGASSENRA